MVAMQSDVRNSRRHVTADQNIGTDLSICLAVTSRVLPSKEHKINKRT